VITHAIGIMFAASALAALIGAPFQATHDNQQEEMK